LAGYVARKANELARMDAEIVELDARVRFVRAVVAGTLVVANAVDETLLAGLTALSLPALSGGEGLKGYEYLLRMRVDRLKAAAVLELEAELAAARAARAALEAKSPEMLWVDDLNVFEESYGKFVTAREAAKAEVAATSTGAGVAPAKKGGRKPKVTA
jgi:hypothetical protein